MPWLQAGVTQYHAQLGLLDKGRAIKGLVFYYLLWLEYVKGMGLRTCARCVDLETCCGQDGYNNMSLTFK